MKFQIHNTVTMVHSTIRTNFQLLLQCTSLNISPVHPSIRRAVETEDGRLFRRNCRHLRQSKQRFMAKDAEVEIPSPVLNSPPPKVYTEPEPAQNSTGHPTTLPSKQSDPAPQVVRPAPLSAESQKNSAVTRSGGSICPPSYLKDYVQS